MADRDLSDDQLHQLLKDAEQRLRHARGGHLSPQDGSNASLRKLIPKVCSEKKIASYINSTDNGAHVDPSHFVNAQERKLSNGVRKTEVPVTVIVRAANDKKADTGSDWYHLPRTITTPELKRDLQLFRMRSVLDPKRHYKKDSSKLQIPEFSQVGTIIEGLTEFFSARLSNKDRKRTFVEEVLAGENTRHRFKLKYNEIQAAKTSGKKAHYRKIKALRRGPD